MEPKIIVIAFFLVFFVIIPVGFGILIYIINKRGKKTQQSRMISSQDFAKKNNMTYQEEADNSLVEKFRKFNVMNQHSYVITISKGWKIVKNPIRITNYMKKTDETEEWEIFDCRIHGKSQYESNRYEVHVGGKRNHLHHLAVFSIKPTRI